MQTTNQAPAQSQSSPHIRTKRAGEISHAVSPPPFLDGLQLNYGPIPEIGRFLLAADTALMRRGIRLSLGTISELIAIQQRNEASWPVLAPNLDSRYADVSDLNSYCLIGRDTAGRVVATQAGRIYALGSNSLSQLIDAGQFLSLQPRIPAPCYKVSSPSAPALTGTLNYSGALWVAPEFRGRQLATLLPRISRTYALGHWDTDATFTFVRGGAAQAKLLAAYGYPRWEHGMELWDDGRLVVDAGLTWLTRSELIADMNAARSSLVAEIDGAVHAGSGDHIRNAVS